jgi:hypothetical protein
MQMRVISHRGFWKIAEEKNSEAAFRRALSNGFGVETDLRDFGKKVVISHDSPDESAMSLEAFLDLCQGFSRMGSVLALNVKADGLQERVKTALRERAVENYFLFDMSVPDALEYKRRNLRYFTRQSEIEPQPALYESSAGVWMDCFFNDWIDQEDILAHLNAGKEVCICSPELHHRDPSGFWARLLRMELSHSRLMLCTDEPQKARDYFNQEG